MEKEGRDYSSSFVSLGGARPGRAQVQHPVWGFLRFLLCLALPVPQLVWQREQLVAVSVTFGLWEGNLQFHGRMAQSSSLRWEESKVAAIADILKYEVLGWKLYRPNRWTKENCHCSVCGGGRWGVGRVKEPENRHKGKASVDICKW